MARTKSAKKMIRVQLKKHQRNLKIKSAMKAIIKESAKSAGNKELTLKAIRTLDKAANKGTIHKNTAARKKSRLMKKVKLAT